MSENYRPNVAVIVTDGQGRVLLCERSDEKYPGRLQTVQGGIDPGETPRQAAEREMREELGLREGEYTIVAELEQTFPYRWDDDYLVTVTSGYVGQEQRYFLAQVSPDVVFDLSHHHREFSRVRWGSAGELLAHCWEKKRAGFEAALTAFHLRDAVRGQTR